MRESGSSATSSALTCASSVPSRWIRVSHEVRDRLTSVLEEAIASPSVIERFKKVGYEAGFKRYPDWPGFIAKETAEMKELARQGGIKEE